MKMETKTVSSNELSKMLQKHKRKVIGSGVIEVDGGK